jgi:hypothetical protein
MGPRGWDATLSRIVPRDADDIDDLTSAFDAHRGEPGLDLFPEPEAALMPGTELSRSDAVCVGVRTRADLPDPTDTAMRLACFAFERDVEIVILARGDVGGLERFGFRTERIVGDDEVARAACEDQIRRFWNLDLVL